jgi:hypothetical protein
MGDKQAAELTHEHCVTLLAKRLHEANKAAGQHSKLSHETAKRYYDRQTKLECFKKGDLVYIHDPTYKRSKARKFSYQYKGPFVIEQKISSLIYRVRMADGTSAVIHVNRLKRAHEATRSEDVVPLGNRQTRKKELRNSDDTASGGNSDNTDMEKLDARIPSHLLVRELDESDSEPSSSPSERVRDLEWIPE